MSSSTEHSREGIPSNNRRASARRTILSWGPLGVQDSAAHKMKGSTLCLEPYRLPWVFTYNGWSQKYDYMMKAAVRSAARFDTLAPYCLFSGNRTAEVHQWLVAHNVRIIYHNPSWAAQIAQLLGKENIRTSHLYASPEMAVGTWQRIDIPIVPELEQFEYVLFTVREACV